MNSDEFIGKIKSFNVIKIPTSHPEKILNKLLLEDIPVLDVHYDNGCLFFKAVNRDLDRIDEVLKKFKTKYERVKILGAEKAARTIKKRVGFICAAFVILVAAFLFSRCVWRIDIYAARLTNEAEIREFLYNNGIKQSIPKSKIDCDEIEVMLTKQFEQIGNAEVELLGTRLVITLVEREAPIVMFDKSVPVDLVAVESGVIAEMEVYNGTAMVSVGDYVNEGDVLISGVVNYEFQEEPGVSYVHAMGKILMYKNIEVCDIIINKYLPLDNTGYLSEKRYYLFGKTITVGSNHEHDQYMYVEETNKPVKIGWFQLPVLYDEIKWYDISGCRQKTKEEISTELSGILEEKLGDKISIIDITYTAVEGENGRLIITCNVKCAYNMAIEREIK